VFVIAAKRLVPGSAGIRPVAVSRLAVGAKLPAG
jgi:hypothetical protein